jgi:hypothetical protein
MADTGMITMSMRELARRERVSDTLVRQALKQGRLAKRPNDLMDPALASTGWRSGQCAAAAKAALQSAQTPLQSDSGANGTGLELTRYALNRPA